MHDVHKIQTNNTHVTHFGFIEDNNFYIGFSSLLCIHKTPAVPVIHCLLIFMQKATTEKDLKFLSFVQQKDLFQLYLTN